MSAIATQLATENFTTIARFCDKSLSEDTKRTYRRVTAEFFAFLGPGVQPYEVGTDAVLAWRKALMERSSNPATVALKLSVVRSLFDYLKAAGCVTHNPADSKLVPAPAQSDELAGRALTNVEVGKLLAAPDLDTAEGARDFALLLVGLRMFLRVHEIVSLRLSSFDRDKGQTIARVKVKGGRFRTIPVPGEVVTALGSYLALSSGQSGQALRSDPNDLIFPITDRTARNIVMRSAMKAGIGRVSPHDLRRTAATRALEQGATYKQVQLGGGWKDPKTIARYDHSRNNLEQNAINMIDYSER